MSETNDDDGKVVRIRPVSRESGPVPRLKSLRSFSEIDRRLRLGWSVRDVARMVQAEYSELKDISLEAAEALIRRYRKTIPAAELTMASPESAIAKSATKRIAKGLDELDELERLYQMQVDRIGWMYDKEKEMKMAFPNMAKEYLVAVKILGQRTNLKMDLGLVKRQLGSMEVTGQLAAEVSERYGKDSIGKVMADPDARRKVLGLAERLFSLGAKTGIDAMSILNEATATPPILEGQIVEPTETASSPPEIADGTDDISRDIAELQTTQKEEAERVLGDELQ